MTIDIAIFLTILFVMIFLFLIEKFPYELIALCALVLFFVFGYIDQNEFFSGFSSSAVIILVGSFFIVGAFKKTGIADSLANYIAPKIGESEAKNVLVVMLLGAGFSAFMSNVATVALLLPTVIAISQINNVHISRLLLPMAFAVVIGGTLTLLGTSAHIVTTELQQKADIVPFGFFDFTKFSIILVVATIIFIVFWGKDLLPKRSIIKNRKTTFKDLRRVYRFNEQLIVLKVTATSKLVGCSLAESNIGRAIGVRVVALYSSDQTRVFPAPNELIRAGDRLLVYGQKQHIQEMLQFETSELLAEKGAIINRLDLSFSLVNNLRELNKLKFSAGEDLTLFSYKNEELDFYNKIDEESIVFPIYALSTEKNAEQNLQFNNNYFFSIQVGSKSKVINKNLADFKTIKKFNFKVIGLRRENEIHKISPQLTICENDELICFGDSSILTSTLRINSLKIEDNVTNAELDSADIAVTEVVLSPRSSLVGKTLVDADFRNKYNFQVLSVWREGRLKKGNLSEIVLKFGDALLLQGERRNLNFLQNDEDFIMLFDGGSTTRKSKAPFAIFALLFLVLSSIFDILPVQISIIFSALIVVLSGSIKLEEVYKEISWSLVFLVSALLPMGVAFENTGSAKFISDLILGLTGDLNIYFVILLLAVCASVLSQLIDVVVAVVLVGQVALSIANQLNFNPNSLLMTVSIAASFSFLTPFSNKASLLVMGAGGYKSKDFLKIGSLLTIILLTLLTIIIPIFFNH